MNEKTTKPAAQVHAATKIPAALGARVDELRKRYTVAAREALPGSTVSRSDVLRAAIERGISALEKEAPGKTAKRAREQGVVAVEVRT